MKLRTGNDDAVILEESFLRKQSLPRSKTFYIFDTTLKLMVVLPQDYDPYKILSGKIQDNSFNKDAMANLKSLMGVGSSIGQKNPLDISLLIGKTLGGLYAREVEKYERNLVNFYIENVTSYPNNMEEAICSIIVLTSATSIMKRDVLIVTEYFSIGYLCNCIWSAVSNWNISHIGDPIGEINNRLDKYPSYKITLNVHSLIYNLIKYSQLLDKIKMENYLKKYDFVEKRSMRASSVLLNFIFDASIPFFGNKSPRTVLGNPDSLFQYLGRKFPTNPTNQYIFNHYMMHIKRVIESKRKDGCSWP